MPVLIGGSGGEPGGLAAVAIDAYDSSTGGTVFALDGSYSLTVSGNSTASPNTAIAIGVGDDIFATGTYDATTGVTYSLTLDRTIGNVRFGNLEAPAGGIAAGATNTGAVVRLKVSGGR
jgi:hypothetical protein